MAQQRERGSESRLERLKWLEQILGRLPGALMVFDDQHRFRLLIGSAGSELSMNDAIGKTLEEFLTERGYDAQASSERIFAALSGEPGVYEAWFGNTWYEVRTEPLFENSGRIGGVIALALDATQRKTAELGLRHRDALLRTATAEAPMLLLTRDSQGHITFAAGRLIRDFGFDVQQVVGSRFEILPGTDDPEHPLWRGHVAALAGRRSDTVLFALEDRMIDARVDPLNADDELLYGTVEVWFDVTEARRAAQALDRQYAQVELAASHTPTALWSIARDGTLTSLTGRVVDALGWDASRMVGEKIEDALRVAGVADPAAQAAMHLAALDGNPRSFEMTCEQLVLAVHMKPVLAAEGSVSGVAGIAHDLTPQRKAHERALYLTNYDALTGVANRALLREMLGQGLAASRGHGSAAIVAALDLDNFKRINDSLGLDVGDRVITLVARRIQGVLAPGDAIARSSGDEFVIVRPDTLDSHAPSNLAQDLLSVFEAPFRIGRHELFIRASIGVSVFPNDGEDGANLLANADAALSHAKHYRRGGVQFYHRSLQAAVAERLAVESELCRALPRKQFELHYQPIVDVDTGTVVGAEALVRWNHPVRGLLTPESFVQICEENGLIEPLGEWVLRTACIQAGEWCRKRSDFFVSVNVSARQLDCGFDESLRKALNDSCVDPRCIELEFTESAIIRDGHLGIAQMRRLQEFGVKIAIDDFGTGYSSLAYLKKLPVDSLKIDRLFVSDIALNPYDAAIARAILALAESIDLRVIAEGVETVEQRDLLRALGCRFMQGYLFGRPVPADRLFSAV